MSCHDLGWDDADHMSRHGNPAVCASAKIAASEPQCGGPMTFQFAKDYCEGVGARMCAYAELNDDNARNVGAACGYDDKQMWTVDECDAGRGHYSRTPLRYRAARRQALPS